MAINTLTIFGSGDGQTSTALPVTATVTMGGGVTPSLYLPVTTASTTSASNQTALTISGSGILEFASIQTAVTSTASLLKITLDGNVVYNETGALSANTTKIAIGSVAGTSGGYAAASLGREPYKTSCLVEFASDGTQTMTIYLRNILK